LKGLVVIVLVAQGMLLIDCFFPLLNQREADGTEYAPSCQAHNSVQECISSAILTRTAYL